MEFQIERWPDCKEEILGIVHKHWEEIALDRERIALDPDGEYYDLISEQGLLHIVTSREEGELVGYYGSVVRTHPHYKSTLFGMVDLYFILPEFRKAQVGLELFSFMEKSMRQLGVKSLISTTKAHHDLTPLFLRLKWKPVGTLFQKWIGD